MNYTNIRMVEQNSILTAEMKELAKQNAEQTEQGGRQAQSMAILAYDAKRDSEVMKAITIVTLVFLPATFVSVRPILCLELSTYPYFPFQTVFSMGIFNFTEDQLVLSRKGWIYLACTCPLTFVVLGASFGWIWWTGKKEEKPDNYSTGQALAQTSGTLSPGDSSKKEAV